MDPLDSFKPTPRLMRGGLRLFFLFSWNTLLSSHNFVLIKAKEVKIVKEVMSCDVSPVAAFFS